MLITQSASATPQLGYVYCVTRPYFSVERAVMLTDPSRKYHACPAIDLPNRQWPSRQLQQAPIWLSTDLRDGNQALFEPMDSPTKLSLFKELVQIGFKEIEIGFPSASQTDFDFVRDLIEHGHIPVDVTPMVITQARPELIKRTVESLKGARRAIVHVYNATAPVWRDVVFGLSVAQVMQLIHEQISYLKQLTDAAPETEWVLQYSPETFSMTELEVSLEACNCAIAAWDASASRPIIINLPTTVENATPNIFADQIEWMNQRLDQREHVVLSVHPHNDRGTGIAAAELAQLAGAQRVEGCLFGNGERSGNLDLVTLALNLYTQGIAPKLDFSDIDRVARIIETSTQLPIHPRHPYVGDLVFTAFSGSHQDAIKKGFNLQANRELWQVPYLPIDPQDLGRSYDSVIRINSQSGKGGIAYLLERDYGVIMPRRMQIEFSKIVQAVTEHSATEMQSEQLWKLFEQRYLPQTGGDWQYQHHELQQTANSQSIQLSVQHPDTVQTYHGHGVGVLDAAQRALGLPLEIVHYEQRALGSGAAAQSLSIIEAKHPAWSGTRFAAATHANTITASLMALLSIAQRIPDTQ